MEHGRRPARRSPALPLAALVSCHAAFVAADSHGTLSVTASVLPTAHLEELARPAGFTVTDEDARRGYVNVQQPVQLRVYSNSRAGYQLDVHNLAATLPGLSLDGPGGRVDLPGDGGTIVQRWDGQRAATVTLRFRLLLPGDIAPGTYPWPVRLGVRPL